LEVWVKSPDKQGERGNFFFDGEIDGEVIFRIRGSGATVQVVQGRPVTTKVAMISIPFPTESPFRIHFKPLEGRGKVDLLESPWAGNGYTVVIRVKDEKGGSDQYRISVDWMR
jgi:hypothetical protein